MTPQKSSIFEAFWCRSVPVRLLLTLASTSSAPKSLRVLAPLNKVVLVQGSRHLLREAADDLRKLFAPGF